MRDSFFRDLRFAVRSLRRSPIFAFTAALVLGLGIGANTTVFTIVNSLMLRPLPFDRADDIVVGFQHEADARRFWDAMRNRLQEGGFRGLRTGFPTEAGQ